MNKLNKSSLNICSGFQNQIFLGFVRAYRCIEIKISLGFLVQLHSKIDFPGLLELTSALECNFLVLWNTVCPGLLVQFKYRFLGSLELTGRFFKIDFLDLLELPGRFFKIDCLDLLELPGKVSKKIF